MQPQPSGSGLAGDAQEVNQSPEELRIVGEEQLLVPLNETRGRGGEEGRDDGVVAEVRWKGLVLENGEDELPRLLCMTFQKFAEPLAIRSPQRWVRVDGVRERYGSSARLLCRLLQPFEDGPVFEHVVCGRREVISAPRELDQVVLMEPLHRLGVEITARRVAFQGTSAPQREIDEDLASAAWKGICGDGFISHDISPEFLAEGPLILRNGGRFRPRHSRCLIKDVRIAEEEPQSWITGGASQSWHHRDHGVDLGFGQRWHVDDGVGQAGALQE